MNTLESIDPGWAWTPYDGQTQESSGLQLRWDRRTAAHLFRRAGFGANVETIEAVLSLPPTQVVRDLINPPGDAEFDALEDALVSATLATGSSKQLGAAWIHRMLGTPAPLLEKLTLFWHGHFATGAEKVDSAELMWTQNTLLRQHALGDFASMVQGIARDPAMLIYLDSAQNRKAHPNENFARELMELFCLGEGNYSEQDVLELARCFTGWEIRNNKFRKNTYQQDRGMKTLLGKSGTFDGEEAINIVLAQPSMAQFVCRKLFRFFVCDEPSAPNSLIEPLAVLFRNSGGMIGPVVERILGSQLFFSPLAHGRKVRSPVELSVGFLRSLDGTTNLVELANGLSEIGQGLFFPPNVKGWDGGRTWINSSTLVGRANLVHHILTDEATRFEQQSLADYIHSHGLSTCDEIIDWMEALLFAIPVTAKNRAQLNESFVRSSEQQVRSLIHSLTTLPEFQLA
ncbi:MAG: DUF1800 domain-containing protein [Planctomycetales bacterium]|nr:DUF1800 domain-containing protein [Planctomycetales bacterium]